MLPSGALLVTCALALTCLVPAAKAAGPPQIPAAWATEVGSTSGRLNAEINPNGFATTYHFNFLTLAAYETNVNGGKDGFTGASKVPTGVDPGIGSGTATLSPAQSLSGLKAETAYRYRVVAANSEGTTPGPEGTTAPPATNFLTQESPATVTATSTNGTKFINFPEEGAAPCSSTGSSVLSAGEVESLTIAPTLSGCSFDGEVTGVSVSMGGCSFKYNASGGFEIVGATCASSPLTVANVTKGKECSVTVGPQGPFAGLAFANEGSGTSRSVKLTTAPVKGFTYTATGANCRKAGTFSDGEYRQTLNIKAANSKGDARGIWVG